MENLKTSISELDLLKKTISNSPAKEVDSIVEEQKTKETEVLDTKIISKETETIKVDEDAETLLNLNQSSSIIISDEFYKKPDMIREFALEQSFKEVSDWYGGIRTDHNDLKFKESDGFLHYTMEQLIGKEIIDWNEFPINTQFQVLSAEVPSYLIFHGPNVWCGLVCLTPNAPVMSGLTLYKSKITGIRTHSHASNNEMNYEETINTTFEFGYYDKTKFDEVDKIGNIYNRLILWKAEHLHSLVNYFGEKKWNSSLFQLFTFLEQE